MSSLFQNFLSTVLHTVPQGVIMKWIKSFLLFGLLCILSASSVDAQWRVLGQGVSDSGCQERSWPHDASDLKPDPGLIFGRLDNGFRYVLMKNKEPKGRVAIHLDVQAGSVYETDGQRGIAHFLEHMVFNGSTHFPSGELIDYFQSIGMSFGGDTNAHTSFDETVYRLLLPGASRQELEKGLLVMADYARGALLKEEEINRERGVILSEKRARDSVEYRIHEAQMAFTMQGSKVPERMPIGILETIEKTDRKEMKAFYDAWYRPEKMILVMVGDFDPVLAQELVQARFQTLVAGAPLPPCPDWGKVNQTGVAYFAQKEPEMGLTEVSIETVWNESPQNDSLARQTRDIQEMAANRMISHRFEQLLEKKDTPFTEADAHVGVYLGRIGYGVISARTAPDKWRSALVMLEQVLRQALEFGFTEQELQRVQQELLSELDSAVLTAATRNSQELAQEIVRDLNDNRVVMSPSQEKEVLSPLVKALRVEDVHSALIRVWGHSARLVQVVGNASFNDGEPRQQIRQVYEQAQASKVEGLPVAEKLVFPYLPVGKETAPVQEQSLPGAQAERIVLGNGVIVNLKQTSFQENEVQVMADFGHGVHSEPRPGMALLAEKVINESGTGKLTRSELEQALAGRLVKLELKANEGSFSWKGKAVRKDLESLFQLLQARMGDPVIRKAAFSQAMKGFKQMYGQMAGDVNGAMALSGESFLAGGSRFLGLPSWQELSAISPDQLQEWIKPVFANSALEVTLVGDFDRQELIRLANRYLGALEPRQAVEMKVEPLHFPAGETLRLSVESSVDKAMLVVAWPTADFWEIDRTRRMYVLTEIFSDRLRKDIREKLGATYSPQVVNHPSRVYPGFGVLRVEMIVDPDRVGELGDEVMKVANDLWKSGITDEELERARGPILTSLKDMVRTNGYWLQSVLSLSSRYPQQLEWPTTILPGFQAITRGELELLARKFLDPSRSARIEIVPVGERKNGEGSAHKK